MSTPAPKNPSYDYVIIGGGTAGLVLANRLSENSAVTVAVLEAGDDTTMDPRTAVPALFASAMGSELDWNFATVPQVWLSLPP
jgi:choline dehydrogenase-like flavoprotein